MTDTLEPGPLAERVLDLVDGRADALVRADHLTHGLTRFANARIHQHVGETTTTVDVRVLRDGRMASASTTRLTPDGLHTLVEEVLERLDTRAVDPDLPTLAPPEEIPVLEHVDPSTAAATPDDRARVVEAFVGAGDGSEAAGYVETRHLRAALANSAGHRASDASTLAVVDGIHGRGDQAGAGHQASRALAELDGGRVGGIAADLAARSTSPIDSDPEALPVVLGPEAVATIAMFLGFYGFNARAVEEGRSFVRLGEQQFDPAISLRDDVTDPRGAGLGFDTEGTPRRRVDFVVEGTSTSLAHDRRTAAMAGSTSTGHHVPGSETMGPVPTDLVVTAGEAPIDDLVGGIDRGLYVTAFNYCRVLDPRTLVVTGLTRNGTFLIEHGQVGPAVGTLRFTQSFVHALGPERVLGVGDDDRYANAEFGAGMVIAPSLALSSWNFTGGARG